MSDIFSPRLYASRIQPAREPAKTPNAHTWRLHVVCSSCTEALPRIFGILAQHELLPLTIDYCRKADGFTVTLLIAPTDEHAAMLLTRRVERIVTVTQVEIVAVDPGHD